VKSKRVRERGRGSKRVRERGSKRERERERERTKEKKIIGHQLLKVIFHLSLCQILRRS